MEEEIMRRLKRFIKLELDGKDQMLDSLAEAPLPLYSRFADAGLSNWWLPKSLGGHGLTLESSVEIVSELAYADAGVAFTSYISVLSTSMVWLYGDEHLTRKYLLPMVRASRFGATLGSEKAAGSELSEITTTASQWREGITLNGEKYFSTNAEFADFLIVIARTENDDWGDYVAVLVPRSTPGVHIVKRWDVLGLRSSGTYQVTFDDCHVPGENRLRGNGLTILEVGLNSSRILIAATALGIGRRIRDMCMEYARSKRVRGRALSGHPLFANKMGWMEMQLETMKNQCLASAREYDSIMSSESPAEEFTQVGVLKSALIAKMYCGQAGWEIASMGSEMFGGLGYTNEIPMGKMLRDMRYVSIIEGGDDVLKELVYRRHIIPQSLLSISS